MAAELQLTYWDSCVFIDALRKTEARWPKIQQLEYEARGGKTVICTSAFTIAEVVKLQQYGDLTDEERRLIDGWFRHKFVRVIPVDRIVAKAAAEIVRRHELKPPDSVHIASAIRMKCEVFYTYDGHDGDQAKLLAKDGLVGGMPTLAIKRPGEYGQMTL